MRIIKSLNRCLIITAYQKISLRKSISFRSDDFIICADGGVDFAYEENIKPDLILGDFDSASDKITSDSLFFKDVEIIRVEKEKDDTDTLLCLKKSLELGYKDIILLGGLGGRFDHTYANLQVLSYFLDQTSESSEKKSIWIKDGKNQATMLQNSSRTFHKKDFFDASALKISLFSFSERCTGVDITGAKYPLKNATLTNSFPIGVSNEFADDSVHITCQWGKLLIILSRD